jgi:hypothetical protein
MLSALYKNGAALFIHIGGLKIQPTAIESTGERRRKKCFAAFTKPLDHECKSSCTVLEPLPARPSNTGRQKL